MKRNDKIGMKYNAIKGGSVGKNPKKHHYLPRFYLSGFTNLMKEDDDFFVLDEKKIELRKSKPLNEGYENYLYRIEPIENKKEIDPFEIETGFGNFESVVAPIITKIRNTFELPIGNDFNILINFLALQIVRTPSHINNFDKPLQEMIKMSMRMIASTKDRWESSVNRLKKDKPDFKYNLDYESMKKFIDDDGYDILVAKNYKLSMMLSGIDVMISLLSKRQWSLWISADLCNGFICSDNPVSIMWSDGKLAPGPFKLPGFGINNTDVLMPISKNIALIGKFESNYGGIADEHIIATINTRTMMFAQRFIYSNKNNFCWINKESKIDNLKSYLIELSKECKPKIKK